MPDPRDFHLLTAAILKEELLRYDLVRIFGSEVDVFQILLAVQRGTDTFCCQTDFEVNAVVNDDVEGILEFLDLISVAHYVDDFIFVWLEYAVSLYDLPDAFFVLGKGSVLCIDLGLVTDFDFLGVISQYFDVVVVNFSAVDCYNGAYRHRNDGKHDRDGFALKLDEERNADTVQDLRL